MKQFSLMLLSCLFFCAFSCNDGEGENPPTNKCDDSELWTIKNFEGLDGCQWLLNSTEVDFRLEPINLLDFIDAPVDGREVNILYTEREDIASACMAGRIVEITCLD